MHCVIILLNDVLIYLYLNICRETMEKLAQFGQRQQEELLSKQEQIRVAHDHLIQNSHSILEAQVSIIFS